MTHNINIVEARSDHIHLLGKSMNSEDRAEAQAMGKDAHKLLWRSFRSSLIRKTIFVDGKIAAIFGCSGVIMGLVGKPWFVTSPIARTVSPIEFSRIYRKYVREMLILFPTLEVWSDKRYIRATRMLKLSGFETNGELGFYAAPDVPFERFVRIE